MRLGTLNLPLLVQQLMDERTRRRQATDRAAAVRDVARKMLAEYEALDNPLPAGDRARPAEPDGQPPSRP